MGTSHCTRNVFSLTFKSKHFAKSLPEFFRGICASFKEMVCVSDEPESFGMCKLQQLLFFFFFVISIRVNKYKPYTEHLVGAYTVYAPGRKYFTHPPLWFFFLMEYANRACFSWDCLSLIWLFSILEFLAAGRDWTEMCGYREFHPALSPSLLKAANSLQKPWRVATGLK